MLKHTKLNEGIEKRAATIECNAAEQIVKYYIENGIKIENWIKWKKWLKKIHLRKWATTKKRAWYMWCENALNLPRDLFWNGQMEFSFISNDNHLTM